MQVQVNNKVRASWVPARFLNQTVQLVEEQNAEYGPDAHVHAGGALYRTVPSNSPGCPKGRKRFNCPALRVKDHSRGI